LTSRCDLEESQGYQTEQATHLFHEGLHTDPAASLVFTKTNIFLLNLWVVPELQQRREALFNGDRCVGLVLAASHGVISLAQASFDERTMKNDGVAKSRRRCSRARVDVATERFSEVDRRLTR
jgi:hypothetical protein